MVALMAVSREKKVTQINSIKYAAAADVALKLDQLRRLRRELSDGGSVLVVEFLSTVIALLLDPSSPVRRRTIFYGGVYGGYVKWVHLNGILISKNIVDAIVYLDTGSTESFQFIRAFPLFLELGARAVCSLENMSALDMVRNNALVASQAQKQNKLGKLEKLFTLEDALLLTAIGYISTGENFPTSGSGGPFSWQEEHFMKEIIVDVILEDDNRDESKEQVYGNMQLKLELRDRVNHLFKFLHKLSSMKRNYALGEGILALGSKRSCDPYSSMGLLYKLLMTILENHDIPG